MRGYEYLGDALTGLLTGEGVDLYVKPRYEPVRGQIYDSGAITRAYTKAWLGTTPNSVTPIQMLELGNFLDEQTQGIQKRLDAVLDAAGVKSCAELEGVDDSVYLSAMQGLIGPVPGVVRRRTELLQFCLDLQRWRARLDEYLMALGSVTSDQEGDREAVLWSVTAPLFLGYHGGPTGTELPLSEAGYPPGFNSEIQHPPDIATPYSLANQLAVSIDWDQTRRRMLADDLLPDLPDLPKPRGYMPYVVAAGLGAVAFALLRK